MQRKRRELPAHPRVRELIEKDRAGTITGDEAQELLKRSFRGRQRSAQRRGQSHSSPKSEETVGTIKTSEQHQAERRREIVKKRLAEEYRVDDRRDIIDENGDVVPNPRFGELLDS